MSERREVCTEYPVNLRRNASVNKYDAGTKKNIKRTKCSKELREVKRIDQRLTMLPCSRKPSRSRRLRGPVPGKGQEAQSLRD